MKESDIRNREVFNRYHDLVKKDVENIFNFDDFEYVNCLACDFESNVGFIKKSGFTYVKCNRCDTIYVNPRPKLDSLTEFYSNSESTSYWVNKFFVPVMEKRRELIFNPRAKNIVNLFPNIGSLVVGDIGAGHGLLLEELNKITPSDKYYAIEPGEEMARICRNKGFKVLQSMLEDVNISTYADSFDLLISHELFEHLHNPRKFIKCIYNLLKPGGHLILSTLSGCGFDIQLLKENSKSLAPPQHLNFLTPSSMKILFESVGFKIVKQSTPGKLDWSIVEGMIREEGVNLGEFWNIVCDLSDEHKQNLQKWISSSGISSHMEIMVERVQ